MSAVEPSCRAMVKMSVEELAHISRFLVLYDRVCLSRLCAVRDVRCCKSLGIEFRMVSVKADMFAPISPIAECRDDATASANMS